MVYRVVQEALNNIAKHSDADTVDLTLEQDADRIILSICDNGKGFDIETVMQDDQTRGIGIKSMSERTELFNGELHIETNPGGGTLVKASWPCRII